MVHLVAAEWPGGPWSTVTLCGAPRATRSGGGRPIDCVVCLEIAQSRGPFFVV